MTILALQDSSSNGFQREKRDLQIFVNGIVRVISIQLQELFTIGWFSLSLVQYIVITAIFFVGLELYSLKFSQIYEKSGFLHPRRESKAKYMLLRNLKFNYSTTDSRATDEMVFDIASETVNMQTK